MRRAVVGVRRGARALHVAVVGGGIVGVSTADELARRGCAVTLLEAAPAVASTASATHGNAGTLWRSMPGATPCEPSTLWHTLRSLSPSSLPPPPPGAPVAERRAFHARNTFVHAACAADPAFYRWALALLCSLGTPAYDWPAAHEDAQRYVRERAAALDSGANVRAAGGEIRSAGGARLSANANDAQGDSALYTKALAADCKARGVRVWTSTPARALLMQGDACVGVEVDGALFEADAVVVCAGAATAPLLRTAGRYAPIYPLRGYSITARVTDEARAPAASFFVDPEHLYCTRLDDARVRFTCYGEFVPLGRQTPPTKALEARLTSLIEHALPDVANWCDYNVCDVWHGDRPLTPDGLPIVGRVAPGCFLNAGHGFNGWRDAGITAKRVAALVAGADDDAPTYVGAWAPARFNL